MGGKKEGKQDEDPVPPQVPAGDIGPVCQEQGCHQDSKETAPLKGKAPEGQTEEAAKEGGQVESGQAQQNRVDPDLWDRDGLCVCHTGCLLCFSVFLLL